MTQQLYKPGKTLSLTYGTNCNTITIQLYVDMSIGIGGDKWPAAEGFCNLLSNSLQKVFFESLINGKKCLELGSGNGLVGIVIEKLFSPSTIVISDIDEHVGLINKNINLNSLSLSSAKCVDWRNLQFSELNDTFDIILALEWFVFCVYVRLVLKRLLIFTF